MEIITKAARMQFVSGKLCSENCTIGLVPTMGVLHEGHLTRVREARSLADIVVVSVFVNPSQFPTGREFEEYPRDLARDADRLAPIGVDYIFAPSIEELYPPGFASYVGVQGMSDKLEGQTLPDHFGGVTTALTILFNIVKPKFAFLGQRDAQQTLVIKRLVQDLHLPVEIVVVPIVRDSDGLACSSRNRLLTPEQREAALALPRSLRLAEELFAQGERSAAKILKQMRRELDRQPLLRLDYLAITDTEQLNPLDDLSERRALISLAAYVGEVRLIDNVLLQSQRHSAKTGRLTSA
jgi:pantoate--beta-alanine ligase